MFRSSSAAPCINVPDRYPSYQTCHRRGAALTGAILPWIVPADGRIDGTRHQRVAPRRCRRRIRHFLVADLLAPLARSASRLLHSDAGWEELRFAVLPDVRLIGANELKLTCGSTTPPILVGLGDDPRHLALGVRH